MLKRWRWFILAGVLVFVAAMIRAVNDYHSWAQPEARKAVGYLTVGCTTEYVAPRILLTAAHCVEDWIPGGGRYYPLGREFEAVFTFPDGRKTRVFATLEWVSKLTKKARTEPTHTLSDPDEGLDVAFLATREPSPWWLPFGEGEPQRGSKVQSISMSLGIQYWEVPLTVEGVFEVDGLGRVVIVRGDAAPGASGSVLLQRGLIVGMITHGTRGLLIPPMLLGATSERILAAFEDYTHVGPMRTCGWAIIQRRQYGYTWHERQQVICRRGR